MCIRDRCSYCPAGYIHCGVGTTCIPATKRCDGTPDCPNHSDERACCKCIPGSSFRHWLVTLFLSSMVPTKSYLATNHAIYWLIKYFYEVFHLLLISVLAYQVARSALVSSIISVSGFKITGLSTVWNLNFSPPSFLHYHKILLFVSFFLTLWVLL